MNMLWLSLLLMLHVSNVQSAALTPPALAISDLMSPVFAADVSWQMDYFSPFNSDDADFQSKYLEPLLQEQDEMFMQSDQSNQLVTKAGKFPKDRKKRISKKKRRKKTVVQEIENQEEPEKRMVTISKNFFKGLPEEKIKEFEENLEQLIKEKKVEEAAKLMSRFGIFYCNYNDSLLGKKSDITYERFDKAIITFGIATEIIASAFLETPFTDEVSTNEFSRNVLARVSSYSEKDWQKRVSEVNQEDQA